jgi:UDP-GlcNAc:undecaprenyl-phosphate GlcNAc-1-phosphate transferase
LIGFFIASVSLLSSNKGSVIGALLVIVIALGVPILDTSFAIIRRAIRGVPVFSADAEHIHHRLILLGYSKGRALVAMYTVCLLLSLAGISILLTKGLALPVTGAILFLLAVLAARYLGYVRSFSRLRGQIRETLERRRLREYFRARGRVLEFEVERSASVEEFGGVFEHALQRMNVTVMDGPGREGMDLDVGKSHTVRLFYPPDGMPKAEWQLRLDELVQSLESCLARWGNLPASIQSSTVAANAAPETALSSPATTPLH